MAEKTINTRIIQKHDTTTNWNKATNFIPKLGELILYTDVKKIKMGDGSTVVSSLPFLPDEDTTDLTLMTGTLPIAKGGTGATDATTARTNLGLGTMATKSSSSYVAKAGDSLTGQLAFTARGGKYVAGRTNAAISTVDPSSSSLFYTGLSMKTPSGSWDVGTVGEKLYFSYSTDTEFNNDTNGNVHPYIDGNGKYSGGTTTADTLSTGRTLKVNLASTSASTAFDGSANISNIGVSGTLPIANGGTGLTSSPSMLTNLSSTTAANVLAASPRPGITGTLGVANGGTGGTTKSAARSGLGITSGTSAPSSSSGATGDIYIRYTA